MGFQSIGRLGVHQFYSATALDNPTAPTLNADDRIMDQKIVAALLGYLSQMDVSAELLQLAAQTDPREIHYLTEEELKRTRADNRMIRDVLIIGYENGVSITEIRYARQDADYRLELYCDSGEMRMLATIEWRGAYDVDGHKQWNLYEGLSLADGTRVVLVSEEFIRRPAGGVTGTLLFHFDGEPLTELVRRKAFDFADGSNRYASNAARDMSFTLPNSYKGLYLLPRTCKG